jgi:hypothetical protein
MSRFVVFSIGFVVLGLSGCPTEEAQHVRPPEDFGAPTKGEPVAAGTALPEDLSSSPPEVSRSLGHKGSVIVLWPRLVPASTDPTTNAVASRVQERLADLSKRAAGPRAIDVRPSPETVCAAKNGCDALTVSAVIVVQGTNCAVAALIGGPNKGPSHLLPWSGKVEFTKDTVSFGESPDALVKVKEGVPCDSLLAKRENEEATIARFIFKQMPKS